MRARWVLFAIGVLMSGAAAAVDPQLASRDSRESKAAPLSDAELDSVTAGGTFSVHIISNPGNASHAKFTDKHIHIVEGGATPGGSSSFMLVQTKKHVVTHFRP